MSKVLETVLNRQITFYMETNRLYSESQHAYRRARSTQSALLDMDTFINEARNRNRMVAVVCTDMSAAFNIIKKEVLDIKLEAYGFDEASRALVDNYLTDRKTVCQVKDKRSGVVTLESGVGEGSVMGPNVYGLGTCDADEVPVMTIEICVEEERDVEGKTIMFADDVNGLLSATNIDDLQAAINIMMRLYEQYFSCNGLCLNRDKCQLLVLRWQPTPDTRFTLAGAEEVLKVKFLGLIIETDYKFNGHVNSVISRVSYKLAKLRRIMEHMPQDLLRETVEALVLSVMKYGLFIYGRRREIQVKLQKLVNAAARLVLQPPPRSRTSIESMLTTLSWLNAPNMVRQEQCLVMERLLRTRSSPISFRLMLYHEQVPQHDHGLRNVGLRPPWQIRNRFGDWAYLIQAVRLYNELRLSSKFHRNLDDFKHSLKSGIIQKYFNKNFP